MRYKGVLSSILHCSGSFCISDDAFTQKHGKVSWTLSLCCFGFVMSHNFTCVDLQTNSATPHKWVIIVKSENSDNEVTNKSKATCVVGLLI